MNILITKGFCIVMNRNIIKAVLFIIICIILMTLPAFAGGLNLSIAASLKDVMTELTDVYAKENPGVSFRNNFASSGALAKQIASGAPADLYFSANVKWMDFLTEKKHINAGSVNIMAYNLIVFVGRPGLDVKSVQDVVKLERISIGSPMSVPAGEYAMQAIQKAGIEKQLENKLVMAKDVRACLLYADRGEVNGSFVYKTDAEAMAKNVKILFIVPQNLYPRVTYPMGMTITGSRNAEAAGFFRFMKSGKAKTILVKHGFSIE